MNKFTHFYCRKLLFILLIALSIIITSPAVYAQQQDLSEITVSLDLNNKPLKNVLRDIIEETGVSIVFSDKIIAGINITEKFRKTDIITVLNSVLKENSLYYTINENTQITVYKQKYPGLKHTIITGKVTDADGNPLELANVYLANTFIGTSTDKDGLYSINNVPTGSHTLVVSTVGYEIEQKKLRYTEPVLDKLNFSLKEKTGQQPEVVVTAVSPKRWKKNFDIFRKTFLGESKNAKDTEILNPDVLNFEFDDTKDILTASADDALIIRNGSLGYQIKYVLTDFIRTENNTVYRGYPSFEKLEPENEKQEKQWRENRERTYEGSLKHFLRSLVNSKTKKSGFEILQSDLLSLRDYENFLDGWKDPNLTTVHELEKEQNLENYEKVKNSLSLLSISIKHGELDSERILQFDRYLRIKYRKTEDISYFGLTGKSTVIIKNGWLYDPFSLIIAGKWSEYRVADLLPFEYKPEDK